MKKTKSNPRGAGRPKLGKVRMVTKVAPATMNAIDAAKGCGSRGEVIDRWAAGPVKAESGKRKAEIC